MKRAAIEAITGVVKLNIIVWDIGNLWTLQNKKNKKSVNQILREIGTSRQMIKYYWFFKLQVVLEKKTYL